MNVYRQLAREFAVGDRLVIIVLSKALGVAIRDLGAVHSIDKDGQISVQMDNGEFECFDTHQCRTLTTPALSQAMALSASRQIGSWPT